MLSLLCDVAVTAQHTFTFKGQVYHNKLGALRNVSVLIDNQYPAVTNDAGIFQTALPDGTTQVKVSFAKSDYTILYPYGGLVLIPRDANAAPQIIVGSVQDNEQLKQYLTLYKLIKQKPSTASADLQPLKSKLDSLQNLLLQLHYTETELRTAKEIQDGKDDYLPEINTTLNDFVVKAIDLKTAFKYVADYAFDNAKALERLTTAINNYNISFQALSNQHMNYARRIGEYWQSDTLQQAFGKLASLALDSVHKQLIYPMQETVSQIREYFYANKKSEQLKNSIQQSISRTVQQLEVVLPKLDADARQLTQALSSS